MCIHIILRVMRMVNMTISVPEDLKSRLDSRPEINWSEVARQAWREKADKLDFLDKLTVNSKATDKDIEELARKVKRGMAAKYDKKA